MPKKGENQTAVAWERCLTPTDITRDLSVSVETVRRILRKGELKSYRFGKRYRVEPEDYKKWKESQKYKHNISVASLNEQDFLDKSLLGCDTRSPKGEVSVGETKSRWRYVDGIVYRKKSPKGKISWGIEYYDEDGKRKQEIVKVAESRRDAEVDLARKVKEVRKAINRKLGIVETKQKEITFNEFAEEYMSNNTKESAETDEYRLRKLKPFFADTDLRQITPMQIESYRKRRLKDVGKTTINREIALLKNLLTVAIDEGYCEQNPAKKIKMYSEMDTERDRVLTEEEEPRLFAELANHVKSFVLVALHTGLRLSKLLELKWSNVNMDKRYIKVEKTKSKKVRYIPINTRLYEELKRLKEERGNNQRVFPFKSVRTAFNNACRRAGIEDFTFHDLRRTFGTRLLERGVDIVTISKLYGHSSVLVTQKYLHPKDSLSREAVELLVENEKLLEICEMEKAKEEVKSPLIN